MRPFEVCLFLFLCFLFVRLLLSLSEIQLNVHSDASDVGYGAHTETTAIRGELSEETLGESSTARELEAVIRIAKEMAEKEDMRGKRVRVTMDSYPALRNLVNGGGSVAILNALVREWWVWCKARGIMPLYKWVPREQNVTADELSKLAAETHKLHPGVEEEVRKWLTGLGEPGLDHNNWDPVQTRVQAPVFDHIRVRIQEMRRARKPACIVVPKWRGESWWPELASHSVARMQLGAIGEVMTEEACKKIGSGMHKGWQMEAHLIMPETKKTQNEGMRAEM